MSSHLPTPSVTTHWHVLLWIAPTRGNCIMLLAGGVGGGGDGGEGGGGEGGSEGGGGEGIC